MSEMTYEAAKLHLLQRFTPETEEDAAAQIKIMEAVGKQIRKRPIRTTNGSGFLCCPACGHKVGWRSLTFSKMTIVEYCEACGQHIETLKEGAEKL